VLNKLNIFLDKQKTIVYHVLVFSELVSYNRLRVDSSPFQISLNINLNQPSQSTIWTLRCNEVKGAEAIHSAPKSRKSEWRLCGK